MVEFNFKPKGNKEYWYVKNNSDIIKCCHYDESRYDFYEHEHENDIELDDGYIFDDYNQAIYFYYFNKVVRLLEPVNLDEKRTKELIKYLKLRIDNLSQV